MKGLRALIEVLEFNPYHDARGRFASKGSGSMGGANPQGKSAALIKSHVDAGKSLKSFTDKDLQYARGIQAELGKGRATTAMGKELKPGYGKAIKAIDTELANRKATFSKLSGDLKSVEGSLSKLRVPSRDLFASGYSNPVKAQGLVKKQTRIIKALTNMKFSDSVGG